MERTEVKFTQLLSHLGLVTVHKVKQVAMQAPSPFEISSNGDVNWRGVSIWFNPCHYDHGYLRCLIY